MGGHEPWFEKLIREATEAGEFDHLEGTGRPLPDLDRPYDPEWWARRWLQREVRAEAAREVAARVRREVPRILAGNDEAAMSAALGELNGAIDAVNEGLAEDDRLPRLDVRSMIEARASQRRRDS